MVVVITGTDRTVISYININSLVSSANKIDFNVVDTLHMSFTYSINRAGPRIEPCGTPHDTFNCSELVSLIHTY